MEDSLKSTLQRREKNHRCYLIGEGIGTEECKYSVLREMIPRRKGGMETYPPRILNICMIPCAWATLRPFRTDCGQATMHSTQRPSPKPDKIWYPITSAIDDLTLKVVNSPEAIANITVPETKMGL